MAILLNWKEIQKQSEGVFNQFGESKWKPYAKVNAKLERRDCKELHNIGIGKHLLCLAMGESLSYNIEAIKKYRDKVDILTCDKGFELLLKQGIKADYVMLCDCNIPFRWIKDSIKETKGVKLLSTPYANTEWTTQWKGERYFYINKDALETEKIFLEIMGQGTRVIPAGSNVSNAMLIFFTGSDETNNINFGGYEKYLLAGYDYSWRPEGSYYAWADPKPKRFYMAHRTMLDFNNDVVYSSENLLFSAKWLYSYITSFSLPVVNCSGRGLLDLPLMGNLEKELKRLRTDKIRNCKEHFNLLKRCYYAYQESIDLYNNSRKELILSNN